MGVQPGDERGDDAHRHRHEGPVPPHPGDHDEFDGVGRPSQRRVVHGRQAGPGGGGDEDRALGPADPQAGGESGRDRPGGQTRSALAAHRVARTDREDLGDGVKEGACQSHPVRLPTRAVRYGGLHISHPTGCAQPPPHATGDEAAHGRGEYAPPGRGSGQVLQKPAVGDAVEQRLEELQEQRHRDPDETRGHARQGGGQKEPGSGQRAHARHDTRPRSSGADKHVVRRGRTRALDVGCRGYSP